MASMPRAVDRLIDALSRLPGIGPKTASRLTYHLLRAGEEEAAVLAEAVAALHRQTIMCSRCCNISETDPCAICTDDRRDHQTICVVEEPLDVVAIENTGNFHGLYHVLHGHISPMERIGPDELRIEPLLARVREDGIREIILATNPTLEGDATAIYISRLAQPYGVSVTRLALGLPRGGDLEYADRMTLSEALAGRRLI
ncbi:MAG: recombination protein RecR [Chloroflexi bacterium]|nr:recombination protein RecR [Chloroflexota bacterium]